jgi:hypothetical protein
MKTNLTSKLNWQPFSLQFPLTHKVVRNLRIVTEKVGTLLIKGTRCYSPYTNDYAVSIDAIYYEGVNVLPLIQLVNMYEEIEEWCYRQMTDLFASEEVYYYETQFN